MTDDKKKSRIKKLQQGLEKRVMLDASAPVLSNQILWLDGNDATTILDNEGDAANSGGSFSGSVQTWVDKSGSGNNATSGGTDPTYNATGVNGIGSIDFNGNSFFNTGLDINPATRPDITIFAVYTPNVADNSGSVFGNSDGNFDRILIDIGGANSEEVGEGTGGHFDDALFNGTNTILTSIAWDNGVTNGSSIRVDGVQTSTFTDNTGGTSNTFDIGSFGTGGLNFDGQISELIVYDRILSDAERHDVENYLATKWGSTVPNIDPVQDTNAAWNVETGATSTLTPTQLSASDADNSAAGLRYDITSGPTNGQLELTTNPGVAITRFTQEDIDNGLVVYVNSSGVGTSDSFTFTLTDGQTTLAADTFSISVVATVNDPPVIVNNTQPVQEIDFNTAFDVTNQHGQAGQPATATVLDGGTAINLTGNAWQNVLVNLNITADTIVEFDFYSDSAGEIHGISFTNDPDNSFVTDPVFRVLGSQTNADVTSVFATYSLGDGWTRYIMDVGTYVTGNFQYIQFAADDDGSGNATSNFRDVKIYRNGTPSVNEGGTLNITTAHITENDPDDSGTGLTYTITSGPTNGVIQVSGVTTTTFTQDDLDNGRVTYVHDGTDTLSDTFDFSLADGGEDGAVADTSTFHLNVIPVDQVPIVVTNAGLTLNEGATAAITTAELNTDDTDTDPFFLTYNVTSLPANGQLELSTNPGVAITTFTQADIDAGILRYVHDDSENLSDSFDFSVDDISTTTTGTFNITVNAVNDNAPVLPSSGPFAVAEDAGDTDAVGTINLATDADAPGDTITYSIIGGTGSGLFSIDNSGNVTVNGNGNFDFEGGTTSYTIDVRANDGANNSNTETITINITDVNEAPTLPASGPFSIGEDAANNDSVGTVNAATDPDAGDNITYSIQSGNTDGIFQINGTTGEITILDNSNLNFEGTSSYNLTIRATDDGTGSLFDEQTVTINITDVNDAPVLPASGPFSVAEDAANTTSVGTINVAADEDVPADTITYSITGGNTDGIFTINASTGEITILDNTNLDFETTAVYNLDIVANDGTVDSNTVTVTININNVNEAPVLPASGPFSIGENAADTDAVGAINAATDEDVPADTITYSITGGTGAGLFQIDNSGNITVDGNGNFNFEGGTVVYTIDVVANDGTVDSNTQTITINITDENDAPVLPPSGPFAIGENAGDTDAVGTINLATDEDVPADTITYSIAGGTGAGLFLIDNSGNITVDGNGNFDFESTTSYTLDIVANDGTTNSNTETVTINITDENDAPVLPASGPFSVNEDASNTDSVGTINLATDQDVPADTITYSITGGNADGIFTINASTGEITILDNTNLDFETTAVYNLDIVANDGTTNSNTETVTINITDVDDAPVQAVNAGGTVAEEGVLAITNALLSASDSDTASSDLVYTITGGPANGVVQVSGVTVTSFTQADVDAGTVTYVHDGSETVVGDFDFTLADATTTLATDTFSIAVTPVNDAPVVTPAGPFAIGEFSNDGVAVGTAIATDVDLPGDTLTYSIAGGTGAGLFRIDPNTGDIVVDGNNNFDFESGVTSYTIDVVANDGTIDSAPETITINILDENDAPVLPAAGPFDIGEFAADTDLVGTIIASDVDVPADTITYRIDGGTGVGLFQIDNSGNIIVDGNNNFDFESGITTFTLDITANDGTVDSNTETITINILDENDAPVLPPSGPFSVGELANDGASVGTINPATDVDVPADTITYRIDGGTGAGLFLIDNTGNITVDGNSNFDFETGPTSFTLDITANDGTDDSNTETVTINILDQNDAPTLVTTDPAPINEGSDFLIDNTVLAGADEDAADTPADITYTVTGTTNGQVEFIAAPGVAVTSFTQDDVNNNLVHFVHDGTETLIAGFDVSLADGGEDGALPATGSVSVVVIPVNDPAVITTNVQPLLEVGTAITLDPTILEGTDPDNPPEDLVFTVSNITNGTLRINGVVAGNGDTFTQADVNAGLVEYTHDGSLTLFGTFDISLDDDPLDANAPDVATVSFDIEHPPTLDVNTGTTVLEDTPDNPSVNVITNAMLSASDFDTPTATLTYNVITAPANGVIQVSGVDTTSFTQDDIDAGRVTYVHGDGEDVSDSFEFEITDGFFTLPSDTFNITIIPQNDRPEITTNIPPSIVQGGDVVIDSTLLQGTDPDDGDADITFTITSAISNGTLTINGVPAGFGDTFTQEDVNNGLLEFVHDGTATITGSFDVSLADGGEDGATAVTDTVVVNIEFVPQIDTNAGTTVLEGTIFAPSDSNPITTAELSASDFDTPDFDLVYNITNAPDNGQIELTTNPGVAVTSFTQEDIVNGLVVYNHDGSETTFDSFTFELTDGFFTLPAEDFNITIIPQNDPPELIVLSDTIFIENTPAGTAISGISVVDPDGPPATISFVGSPLIFDVVGNSLVVTDTVDFEVDPQLYTITLNAFDGQYGINQTFNIEVGDMKEDVIAAPSTPITVETTDISERELTNFTPIDNALDREQRNGALGGAENELLRAAATNLDGAFYGQDVNQVIKDNVIDDVNRIQRDLIDINSSSADLNASLQARIDDANETAPQITEVDQDIGEYIDDSLKSNILDALMREYLDDGQGEEEAAGEDENAPVFAKPTEIQLNEASLYYKNKKSKIEQALMTKKS